MKSIYHFFRLVRPLNLAVIALTMGVFFNLFLIRSMGFSEFTESRWSYFFLLLISTILIAASGNIINDYFDVKADRVNKPEKLIIDKYIKRRWAIVWNWTLNGIGFSIALFLSFKLGNWYLSIISFLSINLLFFYSLYFKRKTLSGNLIVAFLTALVPFQIFIFSYSFNYGHCAGTWSQFEYFYIYRYELVFFCSYAFFLNLIREIVKDLADVKGDLLINSSSLPIKFGFKKTKIFLTVLFVIVIVAIGWSIYFLNSDHTRDIYVDDNSIYKITYLLSACLLSLLSAVFFLLVFNRRKFYLYSSNLIKLAMFFGLLTPLFL